MESAKLFVEKWARIMKAAEANSDSSLARVLEILPQSVTAARKRKQIPGGWVEAIAEKCGVSADWLLFGSGPMRKDEGTAPSDVEIIFIPMVEAKLSAGHGSFETSGESERKYAFRHDFLFRKGSIKDMVLMRVSGDSMSPSIEDGDIVLIDQSQNQPLPGRIYAVGVEDMVYLKRVDAAPGKLKLYSDNTFYEPLEIITQEQCEENVRIIGRAVWSAREL